ncbi:MAG: hypothetical protein WBA93_01655 [Microcoleaceae cyanobacterium]
MLNYTNATGFDITLGLKALDPIEVPVPPDEKQIWFDNLQNKINEMKQLREKAIQELDALLPSILDKAFISCLVEYLYHLRLNTYK